MKAPCGLGECRYHVDFAFSKNCLLNYVNIHNTDVLSLDEISYLYNIPISEVQFEFEDGMTKVRQEAFMAEASSDPELERQFHMVPTTKICCVCGELTDPLSLVLCKDTPLAYCSMECHDDRPFGMMLMEYRIGVPADKILRWAFLRFKTLIILEKALGVSRTALDIICMKILKKPLKDAISSSKLLSK